MSTVAEQLKALWQREIEIEPAGGASTHAHVEELKTELDHLIGGGPYRRSAVIEALEPEERAQAETMLAVVLARAATIAFAAGENQTGTRWLADAKALVHDPELRGQLEVAERDPERYRMFVHGRYLIARDHDRRARKLWRRVARKGAKDALAAAARDELQAPRPVRKVPSLRRINGIGTTFFGSRDRTDDGAYVTTHCFSFVFVPLIPIAAYRVFKTGTGYRVVAREQLSAFARLARTAVFALAALVVTGVAITSYLDDPDRVAAHHFDAALDGARDAARDGHPEAALQQLDAALAGPDLSRVSPEKARRAGAEIVRITAGLVPEPFSRASLDQVGRVVLRYQGLPERARGGVALDAVLEALDGWATAVRADADTYLAILRHEATVADAPRQPAIERRLAAARLAVAAAEEQDDPVGALTVLVEDPRDAAAMAEAGKVIARLADSPALLDDASADVDTWLASAGADPALASRVTAQRAAARAGRTAAEADGVTRAQLAAMQRARPWDQRVGLALARLDMNDGKLAAADARLRAFGPPNLLVRDARATLAQIAMARGQLDIADQLASALLAARLPRFVAASGALNNALTTAQDRLQSEARSGAIPEDLKQRLETASEDAQPAIFQQWASQKIGADPEVTARRQTYVAYADVVGTSILVGTIELRRAQAMTGAARDAMLATAEKAFLAVQTEAEGEPAFDLGLGEIYARLGKTAESDAELGKVLAKHDPDLTLRVAGVYRNIGRTERAKEVATKLYATASPEIKNATAQLLGLLYVADEDQAEQWFRKANQNDPFIKAALLQLEGRRLMREGKYAECERTFAEVAKMDLAGASPENVGAYNNAAVAEQYRYECSGDPKALVDAKAALEKAYRATSDDPIIVGNLADMLGGIAYLRAIGKSVDTRALRLGQSEATALVGVLLEQSGRAALLADLVADPDWHRAGELGSQFEVLAPSRTEPYQLELDRASDLRDEAAAAAVIDRLHHAKALDTSESDAAHARWLSGADDAKQRTTDEAMAAHYKQVLGGELPPRTRAAALYLEAAALRQLGTFWPDADEIEQSLAAYREAGTLWPALDSDGSLAGIVIDEAAVRLAPKRWGALRRARSAIAALAQLVASGDPLAAKIRGSAAWADVVAQARAAHGRPGVDDLRLARMIGDPALETRATAVLDDKLVRFGLELAVAATPSDVASKEDLAYLAKR